MSTEKTLLDRIGLSRWIRSRRPPYAFVLDGERISLLARPPIKGGGAAPFRFLERPLPAGAFPRDKSGIPVAGAPLQETIGTLLRLAGLKITGASLVVPDTWVRVVTVSVERPDENVKEVEEILNWKFAKIFGEPVPPLRIVWQPAGPDEEGQRLLAMATPEEAAASWEAAFQSHGVRVGAVETSAIALSLLWRRRFPEKGFLVWTDGPSVSTVFFRGGELRFVRTREAPDAEDALQEIRLSGSFFESDAETAEALSIAADGACAAGPGGSPVVERLRAFRAESGGRDVLPARLVAPETLPADPAALLAFAAMTGEG